MNENERTKIRELLSELNDNALKEQIKDFVRWEIALVGDISLAPVGPGDVLDAIDKVRGWIKDWLKDMRDKEKES